jgi:hypothetical protein
MKIKIIPCDEYGSPAGKLAAAELHFDQADGLMSGHRIVDFAIWEKRSPNGRRNVTFPARSYTVNGERRAFALVRPIDTNTDDALRDAILAAYEARETVDDDNADRQRSAINHEADAAAARDQAARSALSDRLATMDEPRAMHTYATEADRLAAGLAASRQPGGISIMDLAPGGKYGRAKATPTTPDLEF